MRRLLAILLAASACTGPVGAPGPRGETGPAGKRGEKGEPGLPGKRGAEGDRGAPGPEGDRGPQGERGVAGGRGAPGAEGPPGDRGPKGTPGVRGDRGDKGPTGFPGLHLVVVDGNGVVIGPLVAMSDARFIVELNGFWWAIDGAGGLDAYPYVGQLLYESADCSGDPFVRDSFVPPKVLVKRPALNNVPAAVGDTLFVPVDGGVVSKVFRSVWYGACAAFGTPITFTAQPLRVATTLPAPFTGPIRARE